MSNALDIAYSCKDFRYRQRISKRVLDKRFGDYGITINDMFPYEK